MSPRRSNAWCYWLAQGETIAEPTAEYAAWRGDTAPDLGFHFHPDTQITLVISGARTFQIGIRHYTVERGQCIVIPARLPHRSLSIHHSGTACLNAYLPDLNAGEAACVLTSPDLVQHWADPATIHRMIAQRIADHAAPARKVDHDAPSLDSLWLNSPWLAAFAGGMTSIADIAAGAGFSREGFTRKFTRDVGMTPHAYRIMLRLNDARRRIRTGDALAGIAAELAFSDQSHLGRQFRRRFGVTPRAYRDSMRASQTLRTIWSPSSMQAFPRVPR